MVKSNQALALFALPLLIFWGPFASQPLRTCLAELLEPPLTSSQTVNTFNVDSADQFEELIQSGKLNAGDTIVWADGTYADVELDIKATNGTKQQPINFEPPRQVE